MFREGTAHLRIGLKSILQRNAGHVSQGSQCVTTKQVCVWEGTIMSVLAATHVLPQLPSTTCHSPENIFLRFSTAAANWLCCTTASFTSLRLSMVLMLCLQSLLTSASDCWISLTSFSALWSWLRPVRTPSSCDWIAA